MGSGAVSPPAGSTVYTCMLNKRGGVESDLTVSRISPGEPGSPLAPAFQGMQQCRTGGLCFHTRVTGLPRAPQMS